MPIIRLSTAVTIPIGPFLATNGLTRASGLSPVVEISKNNGVFAARAATGAITHDQEGWYRVPLTAADTGTAGRFVAKSDGSNFLPVWHEFTIVPTNIFDSFISGTTKLQTDIRQAVGTSLAAPTATGYLKTDLVQWRESQPAALTATGWVQARTKASDDKTGYTLASGAVVWTAATRTLTSGANVWTAATKVLTSGRVIWSTLVPGTYVSGSAGYILGNVSQATGVADDVWAATTRTLTSGATVASSVWASTTRILTSGAAVWAAGTKVLTSGAVMWTAGTRTLTSGDTVASSVWVDTTRTLTSGSIIWSAATRTLSSGGAVWDAVETEQASVPAAAPALGAALQFMYQGLRNKRVTTATADKIHTSATGVAGTAAVSFVTGTSTFTKNKYA